MALRIGLGSVHDDYVGLAGATPEFYSVAPYRSDYRLVVEQFIFYRFVFLMALRPNVGHGLLIHEVSTSHTTTYHSR